MRLSRILPVVVVGVVLIGVVVLIVVEVDNYDGRTTAEIKSAERAEETASLIRCPKGPLGGFEEEHGPGTKGETVPPGPRSALICSWTQEKVRDRQVKFVRTERILHRRADLTRLTNELNSLPPVAPLEGEYACPSEESFYMLIGLRYDRASEVQLGIAPGSAVGRRSWI